jgi:hypothetical protein
MPKPYQMVQFDIDASTVHYLPAYQCFLMRQHRLDCRSELPNIDLQYRGASGIRPRSDGEGKVGEETSNIADPCCNVPRLTAPCCSRISIMHGILAQNIYWVFGSGHICNARYLWRLQCSASQSHQMVWQFWSIV